MINFGNDTVVGGKLAFTRLFFRKSKNRKGEECYISKVKQYDNDPETRKRKFAGDLIIIGNLIGSQNCGIDREGRWDVKCKRMEKGSGFVVVDARWTTDTLEIKREGRKARILINGKEDKLRTEDDKYIPLSFDADRYYDPNTIQENIERKMRYLQLARGFDTELFFVKFHSTIAQIMEENKGDDEIKKFDIDQLKERWGAKG